MEKLLTIIIPSYNMEAYLPKCLGSVLGAEGERSEKCEVRSEELAEEKKCLNGGMGECLNGLNDRRACAEKKVEEWLAGVDEAAFEAALVKLVEEKTAVGEYRFKKPEERELALAGARKFYREFARKIVPLSDGRYVYFAPDERAKRRNANNAISWAEYAFHAVSSSGKLLDGKNFRERLYNRTKAADLSFLEGVIRNEQCMYRLIDAYPENDAVIFVGQDDANGRLEVITRLDQFGNAGANLGEVTVIAKHKRKEIPPPKFRPLTEVVEAVAKHQAAGFSPSTTGNSIAEPTLKRKGAGEKKCLNVGMGGCLNEGWRELLDVIVVNGGAKDRTSEIAHDFERRYPGIVRVIDKPNGHYGSCIDTFDADCRRVLSDTVFEERFVLFRSIAPYRFLKTYRSFPCLGFIVLLLVRFYSRAKAIMSHV